MHLKSIHRKPNSNLPQASQCFGWPKQSLNVFLNYDWDVSVQLYILMLVLVCWIRLMFSLNFTYQTFKWIFYNLTAFEYNIKYSHPVSSYPSETLKDLAKSQMYRMFKQKYSSLYILRNWLLTNCNMFIGLPVQGTVWTFSVWSKVIMNAVSQKGNMSAQMS